MLSTTRSGAGSKDSASVLVVTPDNTRIVAHPMDAPPARSLSARSPTAAILRAPPIRRATASIMGGYGFPTISAVHPDATSIDARIAPAPGHNPSGAGKVESRFVANNFAPFLTVVETRRIVR